MSIDGRRTPYPPDRTAVVESLPLSFTQSVVVLALAVGAWEAATVGGADTPVPYNYPLYLDVVLVVVAAWLLERSFHEVDAIVDEVKRSLTRRAAATDGDGSPVVSPAAVERDLRNALVVAHRPELLALGAAVGGTVVLGLMAVSNALSAYPYLALNFAFGAAHGVFLAPVVGGLYVLVRAPNRYIVDIDLLDPDGVGGYRAIGDGITTLAIHGILLVTLDFVILSSVAFTAFTAFQGVVATCYLLALGAFVGATLGTTTHIRAELLSVRRRRTVALREAFAELERRYWRRYGEGQFPVEEAVTLMALYGMFHQIDRMNMWPIDLYALSRLALSVSLSLSVFLANTLDLVTLP